MSSDFQTRKIPGMRVATWLVLASLAGCHTFVPYSSKFMCEKSTDYGRCMDVESAYDHAVTSSEQRHQKSKPKGRAPEQPWQPRGTDSKKPAAATSSMLRVANLTNGELPTGAELYREAEYRKLAGLIEQPVTPLVRPAKVLRTLVLSYSAPDSLYMPRYIFYFASSTGFVIGDYLNPVDTRPMVYPNGKSVAQK